MTVSEVIREIERQAAGPVVETTGWEVSEACEWVSGITVPGTTGPRCGVVKASPTRWQCTRALGHTGRHAAADGWFGHAQDVAAVWA